MVVSEGESGLSSLLSFLFSDGDVQPHNRESIITVTTVTGSQTPTNEIVNIGGTLKSLLICGLSYDCHMTAASDVFYVSVNNTLEVRGSLDRETISSYDITLEIANTANCDRQGRADQL